MKHATSPARTLSVERRKEQSLREILRRGAERATPRNDKRTKDLSPHRFAHAISGLVLVSLGLVLGMTGCSRGGGEKVAKRGEKRASIAFDVYDGGFFAIQKQRGWKVASGGACSGFWVLARDPEQPLRQVFWFNRIGPLAVDSATPEQFLAHVGALLADPAGPQIGDIEIISSSAMTGTSARLVRAVLRKDGQAGEGLFAVDLAPAETGGGVYAVTFAGTTAFQRELGPLHEVYARCLESLRIDWDYVRKCREEERVTVGALTNSGDILRVTARAMLAGWNNRDRADDVVASRKGDEIQGVERLYDPATHLVYGFPKGFYERYRLSPGEYRLNGLAPLPDDQDLWSRPVLDGPAAVK
jgi:hypothetical protein